MGTGGAAAAWISDSDTCGGSASGFPVYSGARHGGPALAVQPTAGCSTWSSPGAPHRGWRVAVQRAGAWRWRSWPPASLSHRGPRPPASPC